MELLESSKFPGSATFDPGTICNLACVTCNAKASTRWQHELGMPVVSGNPREIGPDMIAQAKKMTTVIICGGEPMLNFSSETMLQNLNSDQNVRIHFNGTVMPKQSFLEKSRRFDQIAYCFSIDGIEERFEYLRWPAKWSVVADNVAWLVQTAPDNVEFAVNITISDLNKLYYHEVIDWVQKVIPQNKQGKLTVIDNTWAHGRLTHDYLDGLDIKRKLNWKQLFPLSVNVVPRT